MSDGATDAPCLPVIQFDLDRGIGGFMQPAATDSFNRPAEYVSVIDRPIEPPIGVVPGDAAWVYQLIGILVLAKRPL